MPKLKTKSAAKKRYQVTGNGKIKVGRKGKRHILTLKSRKRKRNLGGTKLLRGGDERHAKSLLPYA